MDMTQEEKSFMPPLFVDEIEKSSEEILNATQNYQQQVEKLYSQLPNMEDLDPVEEIAESLKRSAEVLSKAAMQIFKVSDELKTRSKDIQYQRKKRTLIHTPPANATIDMEENASEHFAKGLGIYKILLICFIGSFAGVVVELLWCFATRGYFESRSGLVYGPFNLLYGAGAVALTLALYRFRNRSAWISFFGGMLVGTVVEYLCSWGQELLFGSRSWDYSSVPLNINGRVCLLYSSFWGILGILWIKDLYPRMANLILKIPNRAGKIATIALTVFFIWNGAVSLVAVQRWAQRVQGVAPTTVLAEFLDDRFPDERMEKIYANMVFAQRGAEEAPETE